MGIEIIKKISPFIQELKCQLKEYDVFPFFELIKHEDNPMLFLKPYYSMHVFSSSNFKEITPEEIMARAVMIAQETIKRREQRIEMLEQEKTLLTETIKEAAPKVEYFDKAMSSKSSYTTTQMAQEFGLSAKTLNARLAKMGVQYRQGGAWILYAKYQGNGYTHTVSVPYMMANGEQGTQIQTRWTEKSRKFLHDLLDNK